MAAARTFVITGSRRGLGRAITEFYLKRGETVFGLSRGRSDLEHQHYRHLCADVAEDAELRAAFSDIGAAGDVHVLINAAGIKSGGHVLLTTAKEAEAMVRTNLLGTLLVTRHTLQIMKRRRFGRVISLSSIAVPLGSRGSTIYGATKAAVEQMSYALSREFASYDITFNSLGISVYPDSAMVQALDCAALEDARGSLIKAGDLTIEEITGAIDFFASPAARNITNQVLYFGGLR